MYDLHTWVLAHAGSSNQALSGSPIMFCWDMGFLKTMTEATMTMTRLRQLPMLWVTGLTLWRIM